MGEKGRDLAQEKYTVKVMTDNTEKAYKLAFKQ